MRTPRNALFAAVLAGLMASPASAESFKTEKAEIEVTTIASGLDHPWGMAMLPDGSLLVTERAGRMLHIANEGADSPVTALSGVPQVAARGQGGLLDVVVDEDFANSRRLWFTWSERGQGGFSTALSTATLSADHAALENVEKIFVMARKTTTGHHFGSRIVLAPDGKLFMTMGERGDPGRAQDFFDHAGSVIRLNRDGSVPADNPFADGSKGLPEIWSKGHRNPQGAAWNMAEGRLWTVEHGAKGGDEINRFDAHAGRTVHAPVPTEPALEQVAAERDPRAMPRREEQVLLGKPRDQLVAGQAGLDAGGAGFRVDLRGPQPRDIEQHAAVADVVARPAVAA